MDPKEFLASDFLRRETQAEIDRINERLHHCERVERFAILDHPADVESGELTPPSSRVGLHRAEIQRLIEECTGPRGME